MTSFENLSTEPEYSDIGHQIMRFMQDTRDTIRWLHDISAAWGPGNPVMTPEMLAREARDSLAAVVEYVEAHGITIVSYCDERGIGRQAGLGMISFFYDENNPFDWHLNVIPQDNPTETNTLSIDNITEFQRAGES